jgi:DNA-binding transcriptional ArsR family regulator
MSVTPNAYIAPWKPLVELIREVTVAYVLSRFIKQLAIYRLRGALSLGFWVWVGFPITMLVGASLWDNKPWELSLIHGGDWLTKMLVMSAVIMFTRRLAFTSAEDFVREELPQQRAIRR